MSKTIEVSDETYEKIKSQLGENSFKEIKQLSDMVGQCFFFRAITYHMVGKVTKIVSSSIIELETASWVADSGRFHQAIKNGTLKEVEPVGKAFLNLDTVVDFFPWTHPLPTQQK